MADKNHQITLASRPDAEPTDENFKAVESEIPEPGNGEMLLRTVYLSLDPYMRGRMSAAKSYVAPIEVGGVMEGGTVCEVVKSNNAQFAVGDKVLSFSGWQEYSVSDGTGVQKLNMSGAPLHTALGILGMPGMTAYMGLLKIGQPKAGETVVVAAASGAVGAAVGQIAKIKGCRVIGIAGSKDKCNYVKNELGFDACLSHRDPDLAEQLKEHCPDGIDVYFENVGGQVLEAVWPLLNDFSRVPVCGLIAHYNGFDAKGQDRAPLMLRDILTKRILVQGFIVFDFIKHQPEFISDMTSWLKSGQMKYRVDMVQGLNNAVKAFQGLLRGENFGKLIVQISEEKE